MGCIEKAFRVRCLLSRAEAQYLHACAKQAPDGEFVELGPFQGGSTTIIASVTDERGLPLTTIDDFHYQKKRGKSSPEAVRENLRAAGIEAIPRVVKGDSADVPERIESVAFLFIDTEHKAARLNMELDAWLPLMMEGGVIALHDYAWPERFPEMITVIDRRLGDSDEWERVGLVNHLVAFRRV